MALLFLMKAHLIHEPNFCHRCSDISLEGNLLLQMQLAIQFGGPLGECTRVCLRDLQSFEYEEEATCGLATSLKL